MASTPVYRPTSLDFINRPNPVEPQSVPHKHPLNGTPQLAKSSDKHQLRLLYDANISSSEDRAAKRQKSGDDKSLDLPKLPLRHSTKRLRIPPTLSGLHQPPPNAGLLPSISTEQPQQAPAAGLGNLHPAPDEAPLATAQNSLKVSDKATAMVKSSKAKRNKWSEAETAQLLKGVARFGIGNWTKILNCPDYRFEKRTALDLKDRFRVCCPSDERTGSIASPSKRSTRSERKTCVDLQEIGIDQPFEKAQRRKRHGYSAAEDESLLRGFNKYGKQWTAIRGDEDLSLAHRTATDLRDRMRTKYPDHYARAGLALRPDTFPNHAKHDKRREDAESSADTASTAVIDTETVKGDSASSALRTAPQNPCAPKKQRERMSTPEDDVFLGAPFDEDGTDTERITLDRGILDWPFDTSKHTVFDTSKMASLDPLAALNLPRPGAAWQHSSATQISGSSALPSLAAVTAFNDVDTAGQLELPSLVLGAMESDGRAGGHFLGFDELLS